MWYSALHLQRIWWSIAIFLNLPPKNIKWSPVPCCPPANAEFAKQDLDPFHGDLMRVLKGMRRFNMKELWIQTWQIKAYQIWFKRLQMCFYIYRYIYMSACIYMILDKMGWSVSNRKIVVCILSAWSSIEVSLNPTTHWRYGAPPVNHTFCRNLLSQGVRSLRVCPLRYPCHRCIYKYYHPHTSSSVLTCLQCTVGFAFYKNVEWAHKWHGAICWSCESSTTPGLGRCPA